uniref:Uncharacterized protein n=1 Tax=uncultured marine virus TaxID=186617 RepID=A0A0F7L8S8_9VIRU|nr:hypothetical protein [uncultured marine virus]
MRPEFRPDRAGEPNTTTIVEHLERPVDRCPGASVRRRVIGITNVAGDDQPVRFNSRVILLSDQYVTGSHGRGEECASHADGVGVVLDNIGRGGV